MTQNRDIRIRGQAISEMHLLVKRFRYVKAHNRLIGEKEIRQRIEIEIAFQVRLAAAFDTEGYSVENVETPDKQEDVASQDEHEYKPDCALLSWRCFRVHSKDVPFWLTVWFSGDKSSLPRSFSSSKWRALGGDGMSESGLSETKKWEDVSFHDATLPLCCHVLIIDARLRFETLPLPVMRDALLGGHLAEELASKVAVAFDRIRTITADREKAIPVAEAEDAGLAQTLARHIADCERRPAVLADDGCAATREAEICRKIELEIDFRHRLVAALDREGYIIKGVMPPENEGREFLREKYENEPERSKKPCVFFFVHSKEASAPFCLGVWFSSDEPSPQRLNWRVLADVIELGPSKGKECDRASWRDATQPVCYLISISDARLRFEALPLSVMRDTLLNGHLAEELASKVALNFDLIRHCIEKHAKGPVGEVRRDLGGVIIHSCDRDVRDHKDADGIESAPIGKASKESGESSNEIVLITF